MRVSWRNEPAKAVAAIRRVLRPGGRFAISVWDDPRHNEFVMVFGRAVAEVFGAPLPIAGDLGPFRLADPETLAGVFRAGGITEFRIESRPMLFHYDSVRHYLDITADFACGLKPKFEALTQVERDRFDATVHRLLEGHMAGNAVRLTATPLCVSCTV